MSEETHPGEAQTSVGTPDYMEKARELADSYPQLLAKRQELKQQINESSAWFYTREEVIYKLSQGAHEQGERVKTSGTSNPVERTVLNCDKVLASMNREIQERREEELITPYRRVCEEIELFEIGLRSLRGRTQLVAHQLFVQRKAIPTVEDSSGKVLGRKTVEAERERALEKIAVVLEYKDRMRGGKQNGKTEYSGKSSAN